MVKDPSRPCQWLTCCGEDSIRAITATDLRQEARRKVADMGEIDCELAMSSLLCGLDAMGRWKAMEAKVAGYPFSELTSHEDPSLNFCPL